MPSDINHQGEIESMRAPRHVKFFRRNDTARRTFNHHDQITSSVSVDERLTIEWLEIDSMFVAAGHGTFAFEDNRSRNDRTASRVYTTIFGRVHRVPPCTYTRVSGFDIGCALAKREREGEYNVYIYPILSHRPAPLLDPVSFLSF